jgi:hypothetical protein
MKLMSNRKRELSWKVTIEQTRGHIKCGLSCKSRTQRHTRKKDEASSPITFDIEIAIDSGLLLSSCMGVVDLSMNDQ